MDILRTIADNPALTEALRTLIEKKFDVNGRSDEAVSDTQLGQMYRARIVGMKAIDEAFRDIASHRTRAERKEGVNPAR